MSQHHDGIEGNTGLDRSAPRAGGPLISVGDIVPTRTSGWSALPAGDLVGLGHKIELLPGEIIGKCCGHLGGATIFVVHVISISKVLVETGGLVSRSGGWTKYRVYLGNQGSESHNCALVSDASILCFLIAVGLPFPFRRGLCARALVPTACISINTAMCVVPFSGIDVSEDPVEF